MANFSNTVNPKAGALGNKINPGGPHVVLPMPAAPKPSIFDSKGFGGKIANSLANVGGAIKTGAAAAFGPTPLGSQLIKNISNAPVQPPFSQLAHAQTTPETPPPAIKSQSQGADGSTKTEYHPPEPTAPVNPTTPTKPTYANPLIQPAMDAQKRAVDINQALNQAVNDRTKQGIALPFVTGQQGAIQRDYGVQAQAANQEAQNAVQLAQFGQPQQYGLTSQPYNPLTDTYGGGGTSGAIDRSVRASNIVSAGDFQSKIQTTKAAKDAADANFSILNDYASQGGAASDSPIINGLLQKFGQTAGGQDSAQVAGFKSQLQSVRSAYQALTGGDPMVAIPDAITPSQLKQVQQSLKDTAQNNLTSYQNQLDELRNGGGSTPTSNGGASNQSTPATVGTWPGWNPQ